MTTDASTIKESNDAKSSELIEKEQKSYASGDEQRLRIVNEYCKIWE